MADDYHVRQFDGGATACDGRNCAAASGAMAVWFGTGGRVRLTSDQFRSLSGVSCEPGVHSQSGGLFISDVIRVADRYGVAIDYGGNDWGYTRWAAPEAALRLGTRWVGIFLGDYDQLSRAERAPNSSFLGDHSALAHDFDGTTVCWHDPLRTAPIRLAIGSLLRYWQKPTSPVRGFAGWVRDNRLPDTSTEEPDMPIKATFRALAGTATATTIGSAFDFITREPRSYPKGYVRNVVAEAILEETMSVSLPRGERMFVTTYGSPDRLELIRAAGFAFVPVAATDCRAQIEAFRAKAMDAVRGVPA